MNKAARKPRRTAVSDAAESEVFESPSPAQDAMISARPPSISVSDYLAGVLRQKLLEGEYLPGMRLVEADITRVFGVSRGSVREAIRRLSAEGLVAYEKYKSPVIRGIGREQFKQMFDVRAVLEGYAVSEATRNAQAKDRRWLQSTLTQWRTGHCTRNVQRFVAENSAFHERIAEMSRNPVLGQQLKQLAIPGYNTVFTPLLTGEDLQVSARQHVDILEAMLCGDADAARDAMVRHTHYTCERALKRFASDLFQRGARSLARIGTY